ncbi:MAG: hypothetical protein R3F61_10410 [Myxococcota bacterium]
MIALVGLAFAVDNEGIRLAGELESMLKESKWLGVEKAYVKLVNNHPQTLRPAHHLAGAEAAKARGELLLASQRLMRIPEGVDEHAQARAELELFEHQTRLVVLQDPGELVPEAQPFNPALQDAIQFASRQLDETGHYVGLLPSGRYTLQGRPFSVGSGFEYTVVTLGEPVVAPSSGSSSKDPAEDAGPETAPNGSEPAEPGGETPEGTEPEP